MGGDWDQDADNDPRFSWITKQVKHVFKQLKGEKLEKFFTSDVTLQTIYDFLDTEPRLLLFYESSGTLAATLNPSKVPTPCFYLIKISPRSVSRDRYADEIIVGSVESDFFTSLSRLTSEIAFPLVSNEANRHSWSDMVAKDVVSSLQVFQANINVHYGRTKGLTCLPLPPEKDIDTTAGIERRKSSLIAAGSSSRILPVGPDEGSSESNVSSSAKDKVHVIEGYIITWTKQIKDVLKTEPDQISKDGNVHPGPISELDFWEGKAQNLNFIFQQLQSERFRRILKILDQSKSTYNLSFAKLCKGVFVARSEANDNTKFLTSLRPWFEKIESTTDISELKVTFRPVVHLLLSIWKHSRYYNTTPRLVVLVRKICNALIANAVNYISGEKLFHLIESEEAPRGIEMLKTVLNVCGYFKTVFFEYKTKSVELVPKNPWKVQAGAFFPRLDDFIDRVHEILDLTLTIQQFSRLSKLEIGGTKGRVLSNSVQQVFSDFQSAVIEIRKLSYDVMDVNIKSFEDDFYRFRTTIKELDRRLGSILMQAFDDCNSMTMMFKLLDVFEGLTERPLISSELEKKHSEFIAAYHNDLQIVQQLFNELGGKPPLTKNLPPTAGALAWIRGLRERLQFPMEKLKTLNKAVLEREEAKDVIRKYTSLMAALTEYEQERVLRWGQTIEESSQEKLKLPLLLRAEDSDLLTINFDPALIRLLREVKYFLFLNLEVPEAALSIFRRGEILRRQTGNLDLIVQMYNSIQGSLLPVERPLVRGYLERNEKVLSKGLRVLNWKSPGIDQFLNEAMAVVREANAVVNALKATSTAVVDLLEGWMKGAMLDRKSKTMAIEEFEQAQHSLRVAKYAQIRAGGAEIHKLLKEINQTLKVSQGLPDWRAYVDFINNIVVAGLAKVLVQSLHALNNEIDNEVIRKEDKTPLLEIELDLTGKEVTFQPPIGHRPEKKGVRDIVMMWVEKFMEIATQFPRLDMQEGTYIKEMRESPEVRNLLGRINANLDVMEDNCSQYRQRFIRFEYLWSTDLSHMFSEFVKTAWKEQPSRMSMSTSFQHHTVGTHPNVLGISDTSSLPLGGLLDLSKFDERIRYYNSIQQDIADLKNSNDVTFLRINSQPIKQALSTWATKWNFVFTQYLHDFVSERLHRFETFMKNVNDGLTEVVKPGDKEGLILCVTHIRDVRKQMGSTEAQLVHLKEVVVLLKSHETSMESTMIGSESVVTFLEHAPQRWEQTVSNAFKKKDIIQSIRNDMAEQVKREASEFQVEVGMFKNAFMAQAPLSKNEEIDRAYISLDRLVSDLTLLDVKAVGHANLEELFELSGSRYDQLAELRENLQVLKTMWDFVGCMQSKIQEWQKISWENIKTDEMLHEVQLLYDQVRKLSAMLREWEVYQSTEGDLKNLSVALPLIGELHQPVIRERHWKALSAITRKQIDRSEEFCLEDILQLGLHKHVDEVLDVVEVATKEQKIENKLNSIESIWNSLTLTYIKCEGTSEFHVLDSPAAIVEVLEEHQMELQSMSGMGKCVQYFRDRVSSWQEKLERVETILKLWVAAQKQWESLESIFLKSADIRVQLPEDTKRFEQIDKDFKSLMKDSQKNPLVLHACSREGLEKVLRAMIIDQEKCQKALDEYLKTKKHIFPRFYFVATMILLNILSNGNNPPKVLPYLGDCFEAIQTVELQQVPQQQQGKSSQTVKASDQATAPNVPRLATTIISKDDEKLPLSASTELKGAVELWLNDLVDATKETLKTLLQSSLDNMTVYDSDHSAKEQWLATVPSQIIIVAGQVIWTEETEKAFEAFENGNADAIKRHLENCSKKLEQLIKLVQKDIQPRLRGKVNSMITTESHLRDSVQLLLEKKVESMQDFLWQSQLRFYYKNAKKDIEIKICDFRTLYSYEYIGNCSRLVVTPLTDRCYVTLTTALRLFLGGAPSGPAGTGKTETTKDLARGFGLECYVFNCSDQMNFQTMAEIFKGLAQTGAWGCFDEFNRIPVEVLSVVTTQVKIVLEAVQRLSVTGNREPQYADLPPGCPPVKVGEFDFAGEMISLVPTVGIFITMNPGYAGRTLLPENLKALFRPCAMIHPDLKAIIENMLMAEGFTKAKTLAVKFTTFFVMGSQLLSQQMHYDWGLRAAKTILSAAGSARRAHKPGLASEEELVLMQILRDISSAKVPSHDLPTLLKLLSSLFTSTDVTHAAKAGHPASWRSVCSAVCAERGLQADDGFINKVVQFHDILAIRHSAMLLGPAGSGKTSIWQTLSDCLNHPALNSSQKPVAVYETISPKALTSDELFGFMTLDKDWRDGVLSMCMRNMSKEWGAYASWHAHKWIVLDGEIDPEWIESLNSVMDDNKLLTLVSNERIPLTPTMRMVFEVNSLSHATPATVSRAGIIYVNEGDVGWQPLVESWIATRSSPLERDVFASLFTKSVGRLVEILRDSKLEHVIPLSTVYIVSSLCSLVQGLLRQLQSKDGLSKDRSKLAEVFESIFAMAAVWAFGGLLASDKSKKCVQRFSELWRSEFKVARFPEEGTIFDYYYDVVKNEMVSWQDKVSPFLPVPDASYSDIIVSTIPSAKLSFFLDVAMNENRPFLVVGDTGTGKSTQINQYLSNMPEDIGFASIHMNYYTDSLTLQRQLELNLEKRTGRLYGPMHVKRIVYFIDDFNVPAKDNYDAQSSSALLRQFFDYGCWFDRGDLALKKQITDIQFIGAMNPKAGSMDINPRLQRHFLTHAVGQISAQDISAVFGATLSHVFESFSQPVRNIHSSILEATMEVYTRVSDEFLPSASRFHYVFSLRDVSRIFEGICSVKPEYYMQPIKVLRLWLHECHRVIADRLISPNEISIFGELLVDISKKHFEENQQELHAQPLLFTNSLTLSNSNDSSDGDGGEGLAYYLPVNSKEDLLGSMESKLKEYNEDHAIMDLVLFEQAAGHTIRISRILQKPGGHGLLVGVGGSGKQSLTRLAAFFCNYAVFQTDLTSEGTKSANESFRESIVELFNIAGVRPARPIVFLVTDQQIADERNLIYVNELLYGQFIPSIFSKDEIENIVAMVRADAKASGTPDNRDQIFAFFKGRVRKNIHIVLSTTPAGAQLRTWAKRFPAILSCTTLDWFHPWPHDALISVANHFLMGINEDPNSASLIENISHHMAEVNLAVTALSETYRQLMKRHNHTTPKSYLDLINLYKLLLSNKISSQKTQIERLEAGLRTLDKAAQDVDSLQKELKLTLVKVDEKKQATDALLVEMGKQRGEMEKKQAEADTERQKASRAASAAKKLEEEAEADLAVAKPALDAAKEAVNCLSKASLTELKSLAKPPPGVDKVTQAVLIMIKGERRNFSWDNAKKMMAKVDAFKQQLEHFTGESIPEDVLGLIEPIIADPLFTVEKMRAKSVAAASLCSWVTNIIGFHKIFVKVKPLMDKLSNAQQEKAVADNALAAVEAVVAEIEKQLSQLQASFREATNEKAKVEAEANLCQEKLSRAEKLVAGLSSEKDRWQQDIETLKSESSTIHGDMLLGAAFVSYAGGFDVSYREKLWKELWLKDLNSRDIPVKTNADPLSVLSGESLLLQRAVDGLPPDRVSMENEIILSFCKRWPLLIDPQLQGLKWLKKRTKNRPTRVIHFPKERWIEDMMNAITHGETVIVENVGQTFESAFDPILSKAVFRKGRSFYIKLQGQEVEYDANFQLFLQTKLSNPHFVPDIYSHCTVINYTVTEKGLEEQLLAYVVTTEEPDLEKEKQELQLSCGRYKSQLWELENQLLERLSNAPADILSDIALVDSVENTKKTVNEIKEAVTKSRETESIINQARELYRAVAAEGSMLFFIMVQLSLVNSMYQYSLDTFMTFFLKAIQQTPSQTNPEERVTALQESVRVIIFTFINRGLFEHHKLSFVTQLTFSLLARGAIAQGCGYSSEALMTLLRKPTASRPPENTPLEWLPLEQWRAIIGLSETLESFRKLSSDIEDNAARFKEWYNQSSPENEKLPLDWRELDKTPFMKLLVVNYLRPDRMIPALRDFILQVLPNGNAFLECDSGLNSFQVLENAFQDAQPLTPLYLIVSPGVDVSANIDKLASKRGMDKNINYFNISLGQGQENSAMTLIENAFTQGHWVVLNNIHLMPSWLLVLDQKLEAMRQMEGHPKFRLFLASDPSDRIPVALLHGSIKLTNAPPSGLRANLRRAFTQFSKEMVDDMEQRTRGVLFGLCHFHAVMVERTKFGPKGFNKVYPFSINDLLHSANLLTNQMESASSKVPWDVLRYLIGDITYGGHITNDFDRQICSRYLDFFFRDELLDELTMFPYPEAVKDELIFKAPSTALHFDKITEHIENALQGDTTLAFGLHPNAELGLRTDMADSLLRLILELHPSDADHSDGEDKKDTIASDRLQDIRERYHDVVFDLRELRKSATEMGPYQNVLLQECERMQHLLSSMVTSLNETEAGLKGELPMTDQMDRMINSLYIESVPAIWITISYPTTRKLGPWLNDLDNRIEQLRVWLDNPAELPVSVWIPGFFSPQSFLAAILQATSIKNSTELDKLTIDTQVTKRLVENLEAPSRDGVYIHGLYVEGARWDTASGILESSAPREVFCPMPVINCRAVVSTGIEGGNVYHCPVYKTRQREDGYVFTAHLKSKANPAKWVLAGVVLVMDAM